MFLNSTIKPVVTTNSTVYKSCPPTPKKATDENVDDSIVAKMF